MSTHTTNAIVQTSKLVALGDAIRAKTGSSAEMTIDEMATAVASIPSGGGSQLGFTGNFTPTEAGVLEINLGYTGSSSAVSCNITVRDGWDSSLTNLKQEGAIKLFFSRKKDTANGFYFARASTNSSGGSVTQTGGTTSVNGSSAPSGSAPALIYNGKLKVYCKDTGETNSAYHHFAVGIGYQYAITYSS